MMIWSRAGTSNKTVALALLLGGQCLAETVFLGFGQPYRGKGIR